MTQPAVEAGSGAVALLLRSAARGRIGHAYLLAGGDPGDRRDAARRFAAALLCDRHGGPTTATEGLAAPPRHDVAFGADGAAAAPGRRCPAAADRPSDDGGCGECVACRRVAAGNHPDLLWISPASSRAGIESLKREAVQELVGRVWLRPVGGGRKVAVVEGADALTTDAGNALLKTLEEPPGDVVFCLLAGHVGAVLPTLSSRCRPVRLPPPAAAPDPRGDEHAQALVRMLEQGDEHGLMSLSAAWDDDRAPALATIDAFARQARDALARRLGIAMGGDEWVSWSEARLVSALGATLRVRSQLERNANFRLAVDVWLLSLRPEAETDIIS